MNKILEQVECFLEDKIRPITAKQDISTGELQVLGEAVDILKDISTIKAMDSYGEEYYDKGSYGRMYGEWREDIPEHMKYGRGGRMMRYNNAYGSDQYSGGRYGDTEHMIGKLEHMLDRAGSDKERQAIEECINKLERI